MGHVAILRRFIWLSFAFAALVLSLLCVALRLNAPTTHYFGWRFYVGTFAGMDFPAREERCFSIEPKAASITFFLHEEYPRIPYEYTLDKPPFSWETTPEPKSWGLLYRDDYRRTWQFPTGSSISKETSEFHIAVASIQLHRVVALGVPRRLTTLSVPYVPLAVLFSVPAGLTIARWLARRHHRARRGFTVTSSL